VCRRREGKGAALVWQVLLDCDVQMMLFSRPKEEALFRDF
jgi:hypothetical protein